MCVSELASVGVCMYVCAVCTLCVHACMYMFACAHLCASACAHMSVSKPEKNSGITPQ